MKESQPESVLQIRQSATQSRLRNIQAVGGGRNAALVRNGTEETEVPNFKRGLHEAPPEYSALKEPGCLRRG